MISAQDQRPLRCVIRRCSAPDDGKVVVFEGYLEAVGLDPWEICQQHQFLFRLVDIHGRGEVYAFVSQFTRCRAHFLLLRNLDLLFSHCFHLLPALIRP